MLNHQVLSVAFLFLIPLFILGNDRAVDNSARLSSPGAHQLKYIQNKGQIVDDAQNIRSDVLYKVPVTGGDFYVRKTGVTYVQYVLNSSEKMEERKTNNHQQVKSILKGHRVDIDLNGASFSGEIIEEGEASEYSNYYQAHCPNGITHVKHFEKITIKNIYPGIDWVHYTNKGHLEYDFIVHPGADPSVIRMKISGAHRWKINNDGDLEIKTTLGKIVEKAPVVFQEGKELISKYRITGELISFNIENYDTDKILRIDPLREWATFIGGSLLEDGSGGIATDSNGNVYAHGTSASINFPVSPGAYQSVNNGILDAHVAKFSGAGTYIWSTYYGGSNEDYARAIAANQNGNFFITGETWSTNFPVTSGTLSGVLDAYLVGFNSNGIRLWGTYYGGTASESGYGLATDLNGDVFIQGITNSTNLPTSNGAFQTTFAGVQDAFLAKFSGTGIFTWGTYYGGNNVDQGIGGVATDLNGNVFIQGTTKSYNLPVSATAYQNAIGGGSDAYIAKFSPIGNFVWGTYFGGPNHEEGEGGLATDLNGNLYVQGSTQSNILTPTGAFQSTNAGIQDIYLIKFTNNGTPLWWTFYGGTDIEYAKGGIVTDKFNDVYIHGYTLSTNFPLSANAYQSNHSGLADAYLVKFSANGNRLWATYYGGSDLETSSGIAMDTNNGVFIFGTTKSANFPVTAGAFQTSLNGTKDDYLVKFNFRKMIHTGKCAEDSIFFTLSDTTYLAGLQWDFGDPASGALNTGSGIQTHHVYQNGGQYIVACMLLSGTGVADTLFDTINIIPLPKPDLGADTALCSGDTLRLSYTDTSYNYLWNTGDTTSFIQITASGDYSISVANQCGADSDTVHVTLIHVPVVDLGPDTVLCAGDSITLSDTSLFSTYLWNNGSSSDSLLVTGPGIYFLTVTNNCGQSHDSVKVFYDNTPVTNLGPDSTYCISSLKTLDATFSRATYLWNTGDTSAAITAESSGSYSVQVVNLCGHDGDTVTIKYVKPLELNLGPDTSFCKGDSLVLKPVNYTTSWEWSDGSKDSTLTVAQGGIYEIKSENKCGVFIDQILVTEKTKPKLTPADDVFFCKGNSTSVLIAKNNAEQIQWLDTNLVSFDRTFSKERQVIYTLSNICGTVPDTFDVIQDSAAVFDLGNDTMLCGGSLFKEYNFPGHKFEWSDGYLGNSREFIEKGFYQLTIISPGGCVSSDGIEVENCLELFVPNTFTPNNDGLNDLFEVKGMGIEKFVIRIYNRWGNMVFESLDINHSWDGTFEGEKAMLGVYTYKIWYGQGNESKVALGVINLIK